MFVNEIQGVLSSVLIAKKRTVQCAQNAGQFAQKFFINQDSDAKMEAKFDIIFTECSLNLR